MASLLNGTWWERGIAARTWERVRMDGRDCEDGHLDTLSLLDDGNGLVQHVVLVGRPQ